MTDYSQLPSPPIGSAEPMLSWGSVTGGGSVSIKRGDRKSRAVIPKGNKQSSAVLGAVWGLQSQKLQLQKGSSFLPPTFTDDQINLKLRKGDGQNLLRLSTFQGSLQLPESTFHPNSAAGGELSRDWEEHTGKTPAVCVSVCPSVCAGVCVMLIPESNTFWSLILCFQVCFSFPCISTSNNDSQAAA